VKMRTLSSSLACYRYTCMENMKQVEGTSCQDLTCLVVAAVQEHLS
jgi:hypothetical protein